MKNLYTYLLISLSLFFLSCEETIDINIVAAEPKVVIDGLITNDANLNYVKLSLTRDFYSTDPNPPITDALVTVTDDSNVEIAYIHNPNNNPDMEGIYMPAVAYAGTIGNTYRLKVDVDGVLYTATETMLPVTEIDNLEVTIDEDERDDPEDPGRFYEILFYAREPQNRVRPLSL